MKKIELLAPGGDIDSIKAAIAAGADAVYCGLDKFNARNRATNISFDDLKRILHLAHSNNCQVFLTLNILVTDSEIPALINVLNKLVNTSIDGIIIQDLGMLYLVSKYFKSLKIHASTQLTTHNEGQVKFLSKLSAKRVNLSRELNLSEIKSLTDVAHKNNMLTEVFVHGSSCISFSGLCYMSSVHGGNSGNRGRCSQPCRDQYLTTPAGKNFPLNLKDNSAFSDLKELAETGVDSIKIEGRIKKFHYVYTVVDAYRKQLRRFYNNNELITDKSELYSVFNRDFSNAFLKDDISREMFIDNPRDHSAIYLSGLNGSSTDETIEKAKGDVYDERTGIINKVENIISQLSTAKAPVKISISGESGSPLKVKVLAPDDKFVVLSQINLSKVDTQALDYDTLFSRLKVINETEYFIEKLDLSELQPGVFIPFSELTSIKKRLLFILNGYREFIDAIAVPVIKKPVAKQSKPSLSILISSTDDLYLCNDTAATIFFQLPNCIKNSIANYIDIFTTNKNLIPWFPAVLIGDDYNAAVELLLTLMSDRIVTNNSGIAFEAYKHGIAWIAGPFLNSINSFSLACLKENFNCSGAFISNEISKTQMHRIKKPDDFELFYSIYNPIVLMTSRQCLFHQVSGCEKNTVDETCIENCTKTAAITNLKKETFVIVKSGRFYHNVYNDTNFLNTEIVTELPDLFNGFLIDLSDVATTTKTVVSKPDIINLFENLLNENPDAIQELHQNIFPTTNAQYKKGI